VQLNDRLARIIGMQNKYKKLFGYINLIEPPKGLGGRIMNIINVEEKRLARIRAWAFGSSTVASFGLSMWTVVYLIKSANESGFWQYLSLIFSENGAVLAYWRELSLALVESLPIASLIIFLAAVGFFIWSATNMLSDAKKFNFNMSFN
jgi:hypothetical protein